MFVAAITGKMPSRSRGSNALATQINLFAATQFSTAAVISGATTATAAPAWSKLSILLSAILPPPTTRQRLPLSFRKIGSSGISPPLPAEPAQSEGRVALQGQARRQELREGH